MDTPVPQKRQIAPRESFRLFILHFHIALRNILRHRRRSFLTIGAVAFSIFCLIVFQALKGGLHQKMMESALGLDTGTIQIHGADFELYQTRFAPLADPQAIAAALTENGQPSKNYARRLKTPALLLAGKQSSSVQLSGIIPAEEATVTFIHQKMVEGSYTLAPRQIILSRSLAESLRVGIDDFVTIMVQNVYGKPTAAKFQVAGLFRTGLDSFDRGHVYLALASAQTLLEADDEITEIAIASPAGQAAQYVETLKGKIPGQPVQIRTWQELVPDLAQLMDLNDATFNLLILIVFIIVAMGIANTMTTVIFERFREFGTLAAIGATPGEIVSLVITESALLGFFAALSGSAFAAIACAYLAGSGLDLAYFTSSNQYFVAGSILKAVLTYPDLLAANFITVGTAILAGLYPAWKAAHLEPVKALLHV